MYPVRAILFTCCALLLLLPTACLRPEKQNQEPAPQPQAQPAPTVDANLGPRLRRELDAFDRFFENTIDRAAATIERTVTSRAQRRALLTWKLRMVTACHDTTDHLNPAQALRETWALCIRQRAALETGSLCEAFGEKQEVALNAAKRAEREITRIARIAIREAEFDRAAEHVAEYAASTPLDTSFTAQHAPRTDGAQPAMKQFGEWFAAPLAPFQTINKINKGADAIAELRPTAERFTDVVEGLPAHSRLQLELLLLTIEEMESIQAALEDFATFADSSARLAASAQELPEKVRAEAAQLMEDIDAHQGELQKTIGETRSTIDTLNAGLADAREVAATVERSINAASDAARAWEQTANAVRETIGALDTLKPNSLESPQPSNEAVGQSAEQSKPFDINDYANTAERVTQTAVEIRTLLEDVRALLESNELRGNLANVREQTHQTIDYTQAQLNHWTDHAALRVAQLIALTFALIVIYRLVFRRRPQPAA